METLTAIEPGYFALPAKDGAEPGILCLKHAMESVYYAAAIDRISYVYFRKLHCPVVVIVDTKSKRPIVKYDKPETMNTDQGSQFTGSASITTLTEEEAKISMDGRGRNLDNIFIERLWRSLKQEAVYLYELQDGFQAKRVIKNRISFYEAERPYTALDKRTPDNAFFDIERNQRAA